MKHDKIHCPECHKIMALPEGAQAGQTIPCACGKIKLKLEEVTVLKGMKVEE